MTSSHFLIISILGLSIIIQAAAAIMAIRLVGITGRRAAWCLIAVALVLMAVRRIVPLYRLITGDISHPPDVVNEVIGLALSAAMAIGISLIAPLFHERKRAEEELARLNDELEQRVYERTALLERRTEELEQANERLKEVDRLKTTFIASMSHELRTPLNAVIGFSSILLNEWIGPANAEQKQNLASINRSGRHLLNMINDVLDVTQIEASTIKPVIEDFELHDLLAEAENEVAAAVREKGLELRSELLRRRMRSDRRRLLQCVRNMLSNAVKFTDTGSVTLEARIVPSSGEMPEGETVEIAVTDTGVGIGEEDQARIFQPFHRVVTPQRTIVPGTGLGLFLTRKIAMEILNGDILLSSEYGKGSRFSLTIPVRLP